MLIFWVKVEKKSAYYYTRVNTGTKIKKKKVIYLFSTTEAMHRLPIIKYADCESPKCAHSVINKHWILILDFLSHHHACHASASC